MVKDIINRLKLRYLLILLALLVFTSSITNLAEDKTSSINNDDTLTPFNIVLYSGDEVVQKFELNFYKKFGKYYADNITPYFYSGKNSDSVWTTELDKSKLAACNKFLSRAKLLPKKCPEISSSVSYYTISYAKDTLRISGDCDWDSLDFFALRQQLFKERFLELESKRARLINALSKKVTGKWYFRDVKLKYKRGDSIILTKVSTPHSNCSWEFGAEHSFKTNCNKSFNLAYSKEYEWHVDGDIYLQVQAGYIIKKNGIIQGKNNDITFTLDEVTDTELRLKFLW